VPLPPWATLPGPCCPRPAPRRSGRQRAQPLPRLCVVVQGAFDDGGLPAPATPHPAADRQRGAPPLSGRWSVFTPAALVYAVWRASPTSAPSRSRTRTRARRGAAGRAARRVPARGRPGGGPAGGGGRAREGQGRGQRGRRHPPSAARLFVMSTPAMARSEDPQRARCAPQLRPCALPFSTPLSAPPWLRRVWPLLPLLPVSGVQRARGLPEAVGPPHDPWAGSAGAAQLLVAALRRGGAEGCVAGQTPHPPPPPPPLRGPPLLQP